MLWQPLEAFANTRVRVTERPTIRVMHDEDIADFEEGVEGDDVVDRVRHAAAYVAEDEHSVFPYSNR